MSPGPSSLHSTAASAAPIVVIGATGGVGSGIVEALLEDGVPVLAVARNGERLLALRQRLEDNPLLGVLPGSVGTDADGARLAEVLVKLRRPLGGVVVTLMGARQRSRVFDQPAAALAQALQDNLFPHLVAAQHLVPLLVQSQRRLPFIVIGSPCAGAPWAGYGHLSVSAAASRMLMRVLHQELQDRPVRLQQLNIASPVRTVDNAGCACPEWPTALEVGRRVRALIDDHQCNDAVVEMQSPRPLPSALHGA